jgi:hypothetical protein
MDHCVKWLVYGFLVCLYKKSNTSGDRTCCSNEVISGDSLGLKIISTIRNDKVPLKYVARMANWQRRLQTNCLLKINVAVSG